MEDMGKRVWVAMCTEIKRKIEIMWPEGGAAAFLPGSSPNFTSFPERGPLMKTAPENDFG